MANDPTIHLGASAPSGTATQSCTINKLPQPRPCCCCNRCPCCGQPRPAPYYPGPWLQWTPWQPMPGTTVPQAGGSTTNPYPQTS